MTFPRRPLPISLPTASLLPPGEITPPESSLPTSLALLGPLPPTTPFHLALNYLYLSDLPDFDTSTSGFEASSSSSSSTSKGRERVLVITGPEEGFVHAIDEDDEDYLRDRGGDYSILDRLKRVDIRSVKLHLPRSSVLLYIKSLPE